MFFKVIFVGFSPIHFSIRIASPAFYQLSKSRAQNGAAEPTFGSPKRSTKLREGKKNRFTPQKFNLFPLKMDGWKTILWKFHGNFTLFFWNLGTLRKAKLGVWNIVPACYSETFNVEKSEPPKLPQQKKIHWFEHRLRITKASNHWLVISFSWALPSTTHNPTKDHNNHMTLIRPR